jgi:anaerobic magnesium-protoporphyrin IX monomethyl ester cyclase
LKILLLAIFKEQIEEIGICCIASFIRQKKHEVLLQWAPEADEGFLELKYFKPDIIGLPIYHETKGEAYSIISHLKAMLPNVPVCVGGPLATEQPEVILSEFSDIDFAVQGEGEITFYELINALRSNSSFSEINGLAYRDKNEIKVNQERKLISNLDSLPFPARDLLKTKKIEYPIISTSRGCTRRCSFCSSTSFWKKWRGRCMEKVIDEIEEISCQYGKFRFNIIDNSFEDPGRNPSRMVHFADEILRRKLVLSYYIYLRAESYKIINKSVLEKLSESGLCGIFLGIDAANDADLNLYNKHATLCDNENSVNIFRQFDLRLIIGFININPFSNRDRLMENVSFLERHSFSYDYMNFIRRVKVYKDTLLYKNIDKNGMINKTKESFNQYGYHFTDKEIGKMAYFFDEYFNQKQKDPHFTRINFYINYFINILSHLKKYFFQRGLMVEWEIVFQADRDIMTVLNSLGERNSEWFKSILELTDHDFSSTKAETILESILPSHVIKKLLDKLESIKNRMVFNLLRINKEYQKLF